MYMIVDEILELEASNGLFLAGTMEDEHFQFA